MAPITAYPETRGEIMVHAKACVAPATAVAVYRSKDMVEDPWGCSSPGARLYHESNRRRTSEVTNPRSCPLEQPAHEREIANTRYRYQLLPHAA